MTAEIAILNRTAVTLAADSAMTLTGGTTEKIYNSVDKIFELSRHDPIGIMIYNTLEFMRVPIELIIKRFRESAHCKKFDTVEDASEAFFSYMETEISASDEDKQIHVCNLSSDVFKRVAKRFEELVDRAIISQTKIAGRARKSPDYHTLFVQAAKTFITVFSKMPISEMFVAVDIDTLSAQYKAGIDSAITMRFKEYPLDDSDKALLTQLAALSLRADYCSGLRTGFVFSGYGNSQIFPSLIAFECDGLITEKVKRKLFKKVDIDRVQTPAEIVPFAQREMVDRFLYGIDPQFQTAIEKVLEKNMTDIGGSLIDGTPRLGRKTKQDLSQKLKEAVNAAMKDLREKSAPKVRQDFWNQIRDTLLFMTKPDLAHFAESLVNITSIKRRVSLEQETVGGPIDVAVISRTDGFVWVKRKHYFDASLNPRYFLENMVQHPQAWKETKND